MRQFATAVEEEGIKRWMKKKRDNVQNEAYLADKKRDSQLNQLLQETRNKLKVLYKEEKSNKNKREEKKQIFELMNDKYTQLKIMWGGNSAYDKWMKQDLNNSHLLLISTYHDLVPQFKAILKRENYNLKQFYAAIKQLGELEKIERITKLKKSNQLVKK